MPVSRTSARARGKRRLLRGHATRFCEMTKKERALVARDGHTPRLYLSAPEPEPAAVVLGRRHQYTTERLNSVSAVEYHVGDRVRATRTIVESGYYSRPDPTARPLEGGFIHAEPKAPGIVTFVDVDGFPTVLFARTGTSTVVDPREIRPLSRVGRSGSVANPPSIG